MYCKVMFGDESHAGDKIYKYKVGEVNCDTSFNPSDKKNPGGFNFSTYQNIARWLVRGDTLYDVEVPLDATVVDVENDSTPHGVFRTDKIILKNPRTITEKLALELYRESKFPINAYFKTIAGYAIRGFINTAKLIGDEKVNKNNIDKAISQYEDFYQPTGSGEYSNYLEVLEYLKNKKEEYLKEELFITLDIDKEPYIKRVNDELIINVTGESGSGKSTLVQDVLNDPNYIVVDTDRIFGKNYDREGICFELRQMFIDKYGKVPSLVDDFDMCYEDILNYLSDKGKIIVIDSAQYRNMKDLSKLRGQVMVMRTCINTCYQRCLDRRRMEKPDESFDEYSSYAVKKKQMFNWYHSLNEFIYKLDKINN